MPGAPFILCEVLIIMSCLAKPKPKQAWPLLQSFFALKVLYPARLWEFLLRLPVAQALLVHSLLRPLGTHPETGFNQTEDRWGVEC